MLKIYVILRSQETIRQAAYPLLLEGLSPPYERKEGLPMYVTYTDLIQIGIFIVALVSLCYQIFKDKR